VRELHVCLHSGVVVMGCKQLEWMASSQEGIWLDRDKVREVVTAKTTIKEHQKLLSERVNVSHTWIFVSAFVLQRKIVLTSIWADGDFVWCPHYSFFPMNSNAWPDDWSHLSLSLSHSLSSLHLWNVTIFWNKNEVTVWKQKRNKREKFWKIHLLTINNQPVISQTTFIILTFELK
jgi:hypothetical protein